VLDGVTPQVQFVKVVSDELVELMGAAGSKELEGGQPQIILMAGLQVRKGGTASEEAVV
jgi:signal recognition particle subunit SRP54